MIRHYFHGVERETVLSSLFLQDPLPSLIDTVDQYGATILWTPYQMHLQCENRTGVLDIPYPMISIHPSDKYYKRACDSAASSSAQSPRTKSYGGLVKRFGPSSGRFRTAEIK